MKPETLKQFVTLFQNISNPNLSFFLGEIRDHETQRWVGDLASLVPVKELGLVPDDLRSLIGLLEQSVAYQYSIVEALVEEHIQDFQAKVGELDTAEWSEQVEKDPQHIHFELQYDNGEWFLFVTVPCCIVARVLNREMQSVAGEGTA